jgi:thioester reductase-like protein
VNQAVVVVLTDKAGQKRLVAYMTAGEGAPVDKDEFISAVRNHLKQELPDYMVPGVFMTLEKMPLTPNGKIDRKALPEPEGAALRSAADFVQPQTATEQILADIWAELLDVQRVGRNDNFFDLGGHSLLAVQLIFRVQRVFPTEIPLHLFFEDPSIHGLATAIDNDLSEAVESDTLAKRRQEIANIQLDTSIQPVKGREISLSPERVLLTGATGFLGAYLLSELLQQPNTVVDCLARASDIQTARQKIFDNLISHNLWNETYADRIHPILGDIAEQNLGLSSSQYSLLADQVDCIIHCAAWVNFAFPYKSLKPANVLGTQTILHLATSSSKPIPVHYISTISVLDAVRYSSVSFVDEQTEPEYSPRLKGGYAQSKWAAERLVLQARTRGLPVTIHRPGTISGSAQSGNWNTHDYFPLFLKGCIQLGAIPHQETQWRLTPVDYVSKAIIHLISRPDSLGRTFHYISPHVLRQREISEWLKRAGYAVELLDLDLWRAKLKNVEHNPDHALYPLLPFLLNTGESAEAEVGISSARTEQELSSAGIFCPPVSEDLFKKYIAAFALQRFI